ncbi:autophagy-related protein [Anaeramoeba flamelloides]|uniref:Autophagy-related protein 9 n=1 Tax=Anaeramoeba flamelloides TaxID=1746091 RepID=A0ABQ8YK69_9EUKA|nr:autophagy-related protein [Anaeramoeba flamelloides]
MLDIEEQLNSVESFSDNSENEMIDLTRKTNNNKNNKGNEGWNRNLNKRASTSIINKLPRIYKYYYSKGLMMFFLENLMKNLIILFIIILLWFCIGVVDWERLFVRQKLNKSFRSINQSFSNLPKFIIICIFGASCYLIYSSSKLFAETIKMIKIKHYYNKVLKIYDNEIPTLLWHQVASKIIEQNKDSGFDELDLASVIMRMKNYQIAMINKKQLFGLPTFFPLTRTFEIMIEKIIFAPFFTKNLKVNTKCLTESNFHKKLRKRMIITSLILLILSPFIIFFLVIYWVLKYGKIIETEIGILSKRQWSQRAKWMFSEPNELPHLFENRIKKGHKSSLTYLNQFPPTIIVPIAKFIAFLSGSIALIFFVLSIVYDVDFILNTTIYGDKSFAWLLSIVGIIFSVSRKMLPPPTTVYEPANELNNVIIHTHYLPKTWIDEMNSVKVKQQFCQHFVSTFKMIIFEILSAFYGPLIILFVWSKKAKNYVDCFTKLTKIDEKIGYISSWSLFNLNEQSDRYNGPEIKISDIKNFETLMTLMEAGVVNFKSNHPNWKPKNNMNSTVLLESIGLMKENGDISHKKYDFGKNSVVFDEDDLKDTKGYLPVNLNSDNMVPLPEYSIYLLRKFKENPNIHQGRLDFQERFQEFQNNDLMDFNDENNEENSNSEIEKK